MTPQGMTLLDGGTGRELLRLGAPFRQPEWSALALMEAPAYVSEVHRRYIGAGADVITTNSYAVVPFHIGAERFASEGRTLAQLAGRLARAEAAAAARPVRVAASLPPVCGSYRSDLFEPEHARPVLAALIEALDPYADIWLSETLSSVAEMTLVANLLPRSRRSWWVSYTLEDGDAARGARLRSGEPVVQAVSQAVERGAQAVLFNCCQPEVIGAAMQAATACLKATPNREIRLGAYANAFAPQRADAAANAELSSVRADLSPARYLEWVREWQASGASIVGGCCGVGPEHIALMRGFLDGTAG
jgi:S-methylmethionine-dependent homocysteine/selenocysteine methylase